MAAECLWNNCVFDSGRIFRVSGLLALLYLKDCVTNLKFVFEKQISAVVQKSFYPERQTSKVRSISPRPDFEKQIHPLILTHLDYFISLYAGISQASLGHFQLVQNSAAHMPTRISGHLF